MAAAVVAVVILGGALVFAGISRLGSSAPLPSAAPSASLIRCETAPCSFTLTEGAEYASSAFDLPLILRPPSDRWLVDYDQPGLFRLVVGGDERRNITILLDPRPTDALGRPETAVGDAHFFARWLQDREQVTVSPLAEVAVAGLTGWTVDVRGDAEFPTRSEGCVGEELCAAVFAYSTAAGDERIYGASSADAIRLYLLDTVDHLVVIAVEARHSAPAGFLDGEAQDLLDTLRLRAQP